LLGTWPVADSVAGRIGDVLQIQDDPSTGGGPPQKTIVFDYTNQRRGGEVISGGIAAHWDGENVHPASNEVNTTGGAVTLPPVPDRPIEAAHLGMARALHGRPPACAASDHHIQARLLRARSGGGATISLVNRYDIDVEFHVDARIGSESVRLPLHGEMRLPAQSAVLLPTGYRLGSGITVAQATVQLLDASVSGRRLSLAVTSPGGGEVLVRLPGAVLTATVDRRAARTRRVGRQLLVAVPAGEHELQLDWRQPARGRRSAS
jgi:hypothetical protein